MFLLRLGNIQNVSWQMLVYYPWCTLTNCVWVHALCSVLSINMTCNPCSREIEMKIPFKTLRNHPGPLKIGRWWHNSKKNAGFGKRLPTNHYMRVAPCIFKPVARLLRTYYAKTILFQRFFLVDTYAIFAGVHSFLWLLERFVSIWEESKHSEWQWRDEEMSPGRELRRSWI